MFINAHCHVFNLQSVYTRGTMEMLRFRLEGTPLTEKAQRSIVNALEKVLQGKRHTCIALVLAEIFGFDRYKEINFAKSMDVVADRLIKDSAKALPGEELVFAPLMMDILPKVMEDPAFLTNSFERQLERTQRQCLRHPGTFLPFVAVHSRRDQPVFPQGKDTLSLMKDAIMNGGFVGIKLYPTLGYEIEELARCGAGDFFDFADRNQLPITMHTNPEGSKMDAGFWAFCQPDKWIPYLNRYPGLRINFAHYGGGYCFRSQNGPDKPTHAQWRFQIEKLMRDFPGRVFADVSYHDTALSRRTGGEYFNWLRSVLADEALAGQVLFGTDYPMQQAETSETRYIKAYKDALSAEDFRKITHDNPRRFLGLSTQGGGHAANIQRHIDYLNGEKRLSERKDIWAKGSGPAAWVREYLD